MIIFVLVSMVLEKLIESVVKHVESVKNPIVTVAIPAPKCK